MKQYKLKKLSCASCASKIEDSLSGLGEVKFVNVNFVSSTLTIDTSNIDKVMSKIKEMEPEVEIELIDKAKTFVSKNELVENKLTLIKVILGLVLMGFGMVFEDYFHNSPFHFLEYLVFGTAYLITGWNVLAMAGKSIIRGHVFNEHFLMAIATLGAFAIDQMPEAVAVMLFYVVGELFQDIALNRSRRSIKSLLEIKPDYANLLVNGEVIRVLPESVVVGDTIIVKAGEKIPLDGVIVEGFSFIDTSALTGESVPRKVSEQDTILAGMINQTGVLTMRVTKLFSESSVSKILELVENASSKKAETEKFITSFAKYYTPVVVIVALLLAILPPLMFSGQTFSDWISRALVVLVISCPCALVISIPLGYFGGIGAASRRGILVKGSNFLDALSQVKIVVFDKTGTLTKGEFKVSDIVTFNGFSREDILEFAAYAEYSSNHPVAKSISVEYHQKIDSKRIKRVNEMMIKLFLLVMINYCMKKILSILFVMLKERLYMLPLTQIMQVILLFRIH
jgi:Cd2+/Zn2+-exporting ATPase